MLTSADIIRATVQTTGVSAEDLRGPRRNRAIAQPRQRAMFMCKRLLPMSYPAIGGRFGNRDHSTVVHAVKRVEGRLNQGDNQEFAGVADILEALGLDDRLYPAALIGRDTRIEALKRAIHRAENHLELLRSQLATLEGQLQ